MKNNNAFKFEKDERFRLLDAWKRKSDIAIAETYIDGLECYLYFHILNPIWGMSDRTPKEERENLKSVKLKSQSLRGKIANLSEPSNYALSGSLSDNVRWRGLDPEPDMILEKLMVYLKLLEHVTGSLLEKPLHKSVRKGDAEREMLMVYLVTEYRDKFGKNPSNNPGGNFRIFLGTLSEIIDMPLGRELVSKTLQNW